MKSNLFERVNKEVAAVRQIPREAGVFTIQEYMADSDITRNTALNRLLLLVHAGKLKKTTVQILDSNGRRRLVPGYKFIDGDSK